MSAGTCHHGNPANGTCRLCKDEYIDMTLYGKSPPCPSCASKDAIIRLLRISEKAKIEEIERITFEAERIRGTNDDVARNVARIALLEKVAEAAIRYDDALLQCADDPKKMASFCTATGDNLDALYLEWMTLARAALEECNKAVNEAAEVLSERDALEEALKEKGKC